MKNTSPNRPDEVYNEVKSNRNQKCDCRIRIRLNRIKCETDGPRNKHMHSGFQFQNALPRRDNTYWATNTHGREVDQEENARSQVIVDRLQESTDIEFHVLTKSCCEMVSWLHPQLQRKYLQRGWLKRTDSYAHTTIRKTSKLNWYCVKQIKV